MDEGGAVVSSAGPETHAGGVLTRTLLDTGAGRGGLVRRRVEVSPGARAEAVAGAGGELWYVIGGRGVVTSGTGLAAQIRRDTALWLPPGAGYRLEASAPGPLTLDCVTLPAGPGARAPAPDGAAAARLAELGDCPVEVTGGRRFRVLFGPGSGCDAATQFVGEIPPGRAPLHSHTYDEVVLVLDGEGVLHAGPVEHPITAGTCIHLPPGQQHCLQKTGRGTLRVLGVFHPGGSPAAKSPAS
jgi:mannose-6-phosphate isomerase-like protein (cupin superfamily)